MTESAKVGSPRLRNGLAGVAALLALLGSVSAGGGYAFLYDFAAGFDPEHQRRLLWDPAVWPPGGTLSVALAEDGWSDLEAGRGGFEYLLSIEDLKGAVGRALAKWTAVERADIRWRLDTVAPLEELRDHRGIVVVHDEIDPAHYGGIGVTAAAGVRTAGTSGSYAITGCVITFGKAASWERYHFDSILMHELGHCLGLDHTASHPFDTKAPRREGFEDPWRSPIWGYPGLLARATPDIDVMPSLDDEVGASLLRPRAGWLEETGSIWGAVFVGSEPARRVYVLASRVAPGTGQVGLGVGAFTDPSGTFWIEGLDPGEYLLWVFDDTIRIDGGLDFYMALSDAEPHIFDTIRSAPVAVSAGERAGPFLISVGRPEVDE